MTFLDMPHDDYWGSDPNFPFEDWQYEVANNATRHGYWDWVAHRQVDWFDDPPVDDPPSEHERLTREVQ